MDLYQNKQEEISYVHKRQISSKIVILQGLEV